MGRRNKTVMHATDEIQQLFCQRIWDKSGLALFAGLLVLATVAAAEESNTEIWREQVAEEGDQQVQLNAGLATSQRSSMETELKKAQERAQLAEKMADLAQSQQSALETELKKALERAQLAEKNADINERKLRALEAALAEKGDQLEIELKKAQERGQPAEKNADLTDPNSGPKAKPLASTQPSGSLIQSAEMTALPCLTPNSAPAAIESQNENKGIDFAAATAPVAVEPETASKNDPVRPDQQPAKLAQINHDRSAVPLPTPSAAASMLPTPPVVQTNRGIQTSLEVQALKELILEYHRMNMISPQEDSFPEMETPNSIRTPVPELAAEINQPTAQANASPESSLQRHDSPRVIPPKILNTRHRLLVRFRHVDLKMRLLALWHQSLARSQRVRRQH